MSISKAAGFLQDAQLVPHGSELIPDLREISFEINFSSTIAKDPLEI